MPMKRELYSEDWPAVSVAAKTRAGWKCEICGASHETLIARRKDNPFIWRAVSYGEAEELAISGWHDIDHLTPILVVLTTHHKGAPLPDGSPGDPNDKKDNRPENLQVLCQRCHLLAERDIREARRKPRPHQTTLWEEGEE